jgi:hypothetical protein
MAAITGIGRRDKGECHRPRYEVAALGGCNVDGWRESPLWELDLSGPMQKRIPDSIENIGMFNDWLADESMGQSLPRDFFDALALFKHRLQNLHDKAKDSRKRRATAKREALARPTSGLTSAAMAKAVAP